MGLKIVEENLDGVEEAFHSLYTEKDGKFHLTGVDGMKTEADVSRLNTALIKERNDHKGLKEKYGLLGGQDPVEILAQLDRIPELEAAAKGSLDETKLNELAEARAKVKLAPLERELATAKTKVVELEGITSQFQEKERTNKIHSAIKNAAKEAKVSPEAIEDAVLIGERLFELAEDGSVIAKANSGINEGINPAMWLSDIQDKKPHWWGESIGGGAGGNKGGFNSGSNPWTDAHWNLTEQGAVYTKNPAKAEQLAKAAGTTVGGKRPTKK